MIFWISSFLIILHIAGFYVASRAMMQNRPPQSMLAWLLGLIICPSITLPFYFLFGRNRLQGYAESRRNRDRAISELSQKTINKVAKLRWEYSGPNFQQKEFFRALNKITGLGFTHGNKVDLLIDGKKTYETLFQAMESAEEFLLVEFFIVKDDKVGDRFHQILCSKARAGVKVWLIFDDIGSYKLKFRYLYTLRKAGVNVLPFGGKRSRWKNLFHINFRNHRKLVIVDGKKAFLGGVNIGAEYLGDGPLGRWRDTFIGLQGTCVHAAQLIFLEDWHWASQGEILNLSWSNATFETTDEPIMILPTGPADPYPGWRMSVICAANAARNRLWITSPYFVPDDGVLAALSAASIRGVDVRILLPQKIDHYSAYFASLTYYEETLPHGIKIFRYREGFLHQKALLIDDWAAMIGTANLDNRSLVLNFEIMGVMTGEKTIRKIQHMLERDFSRSREVQLRDYQKRSRTFHMVCQFCRLLSPVL